MPDYLPIAESCQSEIIHCPDAVLEEAAASKRMVATYDLHITGPSPLPPELQVMSGQSFDSRSAAFSGLRAAIAEAMRGAALQEHPVTHRLMQWADEMERSAALSRPASWIITNSAAPFTFMLIRRR
jgi:hypothetical protein